MTRSGAFDPELDCVGAVFVAYALDEFTASRRGSTVHRPGTDG